MRVVLGVRLNRYRDGDTLVVGGERIRLHRIDAPESRRICQSIFGQGERAGDASSRASGFNTSAHTASGIARQPTLQTPAFP
jgi:endonuclease YncB( thermonuclease family)